jgi:hypothetical protein
VLKFSEQDPLNMITRDFYIESKSFRLSSCSKPNDSFRFPLESWGFEPGTQIITFHETEEEEAQYKAACTFVLSFHTNWPPSVLPSCFTQSYQLQELYTLLESEKVVVFFSSGDPL